MATQIAHGIFTQEEMDAAVAAYRERVRPSDSDDLKQLLKKQAFQTHLALEHEKQDRALAILQDILIADLESAFEGTDPEPEPEVDADLKTQLQGLEPEPEPVEETEKVDGDGAEETEPEPVDTTEDAVDEFLEDKEQPPPEAVEEAEAEEHIKVEPLSDKVKTEIAEQLTGESVMSQVKNLIKNDTNWWAVLGIEGATGLEKGEIKYALDYLVKSGKVEQDKMNYRWIAEEGEARDD